MRAPTFIAGFGAALLIGCAGSPSNTASDVLSFYVVSDNRIEDGRFIDTPDQPRLGYIAPTPDLVITRLKSVVRDKYQLSANTLDANGHRVAGAWRERAALRLNMYTVDAKRLTEFTERAVGKQTLVMLGDSPLIAPRVVSPITTHSILVTFGEHADINEIEHALNKLVK